MEKEEMRFKERRNVLKGIGATGLATTGLGLTSGLATAYQEEDYQWRKTDNDYKTYDPSGQPYDYYTELTSSLVYFGSSVNSSDNWQHKFRLTGDYFSRYDDGSGWQKQKDVIHMTTNADNKMSGSTTLYTPDEGKGLGAKPEPDAGGDPENFADFAFTAFKASLGAASPTVGAIITASDLTSALLGTPFADEDPDYDFRWEYWNDDVSDPHHHVNIITEGSSGESSSQFTTDQWGLADQASGGEQRHIGWNVYVDPVSNLSIEPSGPTVSSDSGSVETTQRKDRTFESVSSPPIPYDKIPANSSLKEFADGGPIKTVRLPTQVKRRSRPDEEPSRKPRSERQ